MFGKEPEGDDNEAGVEEPVRSITAGDSAKGCWPSSKSISWLEMLGMFAESLSIQDRSRLPASDGTKMAQPLAVALTYRIIIHFQLKVGKMRHFQLKMGTMRHFQLKMEKMWEFWSAF